MKLVSYDEAKEVVLNYKDKDKIQVLCIINKESDCPLCKNILEKDDNPLVLIQNEGIIDLHVIDAEEAYGFFKPPTMFFMYYYIPWNLKKSPQIRDHFLPYDDMKKDFIYWVNKKG
jgi:hypothetical protein